MDIYPLLKSLHIIFVITWFAGLFYFPRILIHQTEAQAKDEPEKSILTKHTKKTGKDLEQWESMAENPAERIRLFIDILIRNQSKIKRYGCPVGTLCTELAKVHHQSQEEANKIFTLYRNWLIKEFIRLGCKENADERAMHLLVLSQGVATMAHAFQDEEFIKQEVQKMYDWLDSCIDSADHKKDK